MANKYRWFTHDHDAHDDPFISAAMDRFGHLGYSAYFTIIELLHRDGVGDSLRISAPRLCLKLRSKRPAVRKYLDYCREANKMEIKWIGDEVEIKINKFRERQSKMKSNLPSTFSQPSANLPLEGEGEREAEGQNGNGLVHLDLNDFTETAPATAQEATAGPKKKVAAPVAVPLDFQKFWAAYPKRQNKGAALRAWAKLRPDAGLMSQILRAIQVQSASKDWQKNGGEFIPHPASWLNGRRWEDDVAPVSDLEGSRMRAETAAHRAMMTDKSEHFS